eukprot:c33043_g1_i1 orf=3-161(-)
MKHPDDISLQLYDLRCHDHTTICVVNLRMLLKARKHVHSCFMSGSAEGAFIRI